MRRLISLVSSTSLCAVGLSAQATVPEAFSLKHIVLDVAIDYPAQRLAGSASLELENQASRPAREVSLLLNRLMEASAVQEGSGEALRFTQDVVRMRDLPLRQVTSCVFSCHERSKPVSA
jgi:hypothetical protein